MKRIIRPIDLPKPVTGPWTLADLKSGKIGNPNNNLKVFSCFHCGGGSTMGYKLAGFNVLGGVEIDTDMMKLYVKNHSPSDGHSFLMPIQDFPAMQDSSLPRDLFDLDVLDGSPPCSSFSMAGAREDGWNKKKMFREGQTEQVLDDLFFHFIKVADKLKPKIVIAENVKGLIMGKARGYVREIFKAYDDIGYETQLFLLNSSRMGVPQARERTFFIARRKDLGVPRLSLDFSEDPISSSAAIAGLSLDGSEKKLSDRALELYKKTLPGESFAKRNNGSWFNSVRMSANKPAPTVTATCCLYHYSEPRLITYSEAKRLQTFPDDYDFMDQDGRYVCGMSVPPLMMQRVAIEVARALLSMRKT